MGSVGFGRIRDCITLGSPKVGWPGWLWVEVVGLSYVLRRTWQRNGHTQPCGVLPEFLRVYRWPVWSDLRGGRIGGQ